MNENSYAYKTLELIRIIRTCHSSCYQKINAIKCTSQDGLNNECIGTSDGSWNAEEEEKYLESLSKSINRAQIDRMYANIGGIVTL